MMEVFSWLMANWQVIVTTLLTIIGGASVIVKAIAPLTRTESDNKLVGLLEKIQAWFAKLSLNTPSNVKNTTSAPKLTP